MDSPYKTQAKHLYAVLQRIQKWFKGEDLYEVVVLEAQDDCPYDFMWSHQLGGLMYRVSEEDKWHKVLNLNHVEPMIFCISQIERIMDEARERRDAIADLAAMASAQGEALLEKLSDFARSDRTETLEG